MLKAMSSVAYLVLGHICGAECYARELRHLANYALLAHVSLQAASVSYILTQPNMMYMLPGILPKAMSLLHITIDPVLRAAVVEHALHTQVSLKSQFPACKMNKISQ